MIVCNTFFKPSNGNKSNLATWYSADGEIAKQLDYIIIDEKSRNWVKKLIITKMQIS